MPVWGISLSAPLGIAGLVGRRPANYLMPRMPISDQPEGLSRIGHAPSAEHGVLDHVSMDCPPVGGRLHTRYAPIRRSPAGHRCPLLPLDLHVLSLPLAFILSQDQTLHCKNCNRRERAPRGATGAVTYLGLIPLAAADTTTPLGAGTAPHAIPCLNRLNLLSPSPSETAARAGHPQSGKASAKVRQISHTAEKIFRQGGNVFANALYYSTL